MSKTDKFMMSLGFTGLVIILLASAVKPETSEQIEVPPTNTCDTTYTYRQP